MTEQTRGPGHNLPLKSRTDDLVSAANEWAKTTIADQEQADLLSAFIDQLRAAEKEVETTRKQAKQPHMDAASAVDKQYKPLSDLLATAKGLVMPKLTAWLQMLEAERKERERLAQEEANRKAEEARKAAEAAAKEAAKGGDVVGATVAAQQAQEVAEAAQAQAAKVAAAPVNLKSSFGARTKTLRTTYRATITSNAMALGHYRHHPDIIAALQRVADADARARAAGLEGVSDVPGVDWTAEQNAA